MCTAYVSQYSNGGEHGVSMAVGSIRMWPSYKLMVLRHRFVIKIFLKESYVQPVVYCCHLIVAQNSGVKECLKGRHHGGGLGYVRYGLDCCQCALDFFNMPLLLHAHKPA